MKTKKKNPILIMDEYLETLREYERSPFPLIEPEYSRINIESGNVRVAFGLQSQGMLDFINRAIDDGMGWIQIGHSIGWIGFAVLNSYYSDLYRSLYEDMGLIMVDCNEKPYIGRAVYEPKTHKLSIAKETIESDDSDPFSSLKNVIDTVQFLVKDKELFEKSSKEIPPIYMVQSRDPSNIKYHTTMIKGELSIVIKSVSFYCLLNEIVEMRFQGWVHKGKVYYDLPELEESKKYYIRDKLIFSLLNLNFPK